MGEVYRARDTRLGRDVALKVLPISRYDDPALLARFEREAQALAALNHPHIAAIYDVVDVGDYRAIVSGWPLPSIAIDPATCVGSAEDGSRQPTVRNESFDCRTRSDSPLRARPQAQP
jgi:hypothetical protein